MNNIPKSFLNERGCVLLLVVLLTVLLQSAAGAQGQAFLLKQARSVSEKSPAAGFKLYESLCRKYPYDLSLLYEKIRTGRDAEKPPRLEECNRLIEADPLAKRYRHIYTWRALAHMDNFDEEAALNDCIKSAQLGDKAGETAILMCKLYQAMNRHNEAIACIKEKFKLENKEDSYGHELMAYSYSALKQEESALKEYERSLALDPNNLKVLLNHAVYLEQIHRGKEALKDLERILKIEKNNDIALQLRAKIYYKLGRYKECISDLNQYVQTEFNKEPAPSALELRAEAYKKLGLSALARKDLDRSKQIRDKH
ncbi:MAG: hypothetical protein K2Y32_05625 [Candidatus Obscuribacterales bacterium]|nr:hypothetical protein [Candidatus Obscuribacterales bacterium]